MENIGILSIIPSAQRSEIIRIMESRRCSVCDLSELRLRVRGISSVTLSGRRIRLLSKITQEEIEKTLSRMTLGELYLKRDQINEGFITLGGGIRVGVIGTARYDGGRLVGVGEISSLVFRVPTGACEFGDELCEAFNKCDSGMLIYSRPGVGKTSALRALCERLGSGGFNVALIDERGEFSSDAFVGKSIDHLLGYSRRLGLEIALRCLSPDVIVVDEIGNSDECDSILGLSHAGVRIIATAHASTFSELSQRTSLKSLFDARTFDVYAGISLKDGKRQLEIKECWK